jgi:putative SOS response-associated peptidase YedK
MCNLYSVTKGQSAIRDLFAVKHDRAGNLPPLPAILPDQMAPIVRVGADGERELVMARWGMPGPPHFGSQPVRNIRNVRSPHWRGRFGKESRCIVPATSFCEYSDTMPRKTPVWFALAAERPLFAFAGLWMPCRDLHRAKSALVESDHELLFGFLTTEANATVAPIHPQAMPVILTTPAEIERWLEAESADALSLQRPLPDNALRIVAKGERSDCPGFSDKPREIVPSKQTDSTGPRPPPASKADEHEPTIPSEAVQEPDADHSLNRLAQLLKPGPPSSPPVTRSAPVADAVRVTRPPPGESRELEQDPSLPPAMAQWRSRRRTLIAFALALPVLAAVASFFMLNRGPGLLKRDLFAAAPDPLSASPSKDNHLADRAGAGSPHHEDATSVETLLSVKPPASSGSASPPAGGPVGADPAHPAPIVASPAADLSTGAVQAPIAEPPPSAAPIAAPVSSAAEPEKALSGGVASSGPVKPGSETPVEMAKSEELSTPRAQPPATLSGASSGSATAVKTNATNSSAPMSERPLPARRHAKHKKVNKTHVIAQAVHPAAPPQPAEPVAPPGNPLLRAVGNAFK